MVIKQGYKTKLMKRTPDSISKKRQQLRKEIESLESLIDSIKYSVCLTYEQKKEQQERIRQAQLQIDNCNKQLHNSFKLCGRTSTDFLFKYDKLTPGTY